MKRWIPTSVVVAVAVAALPLVVSAETGRSLLERQAFRSKVKAAHTTSRNWTDLPGLSGDRGVRVCSQHLRQVTADLSVVAAGAPSAFRLVVDGVPENPMEPGAIVVTPNGADSDSFTFAATLADFEDNSNHHVAVQWRSRTGGEAVVRRALLNVLYDEAAEEQC